MRRRYLWALPVLLLGAALYYRVRPEEGGHRPVLPKPAVDAGVNTDPLPRCAALDGPSQKSDGGALKWCSEAASSQRPVCPSGDKIAWFIDDDAATRAAGERGFRWLVTKRPAWPSSLCADMDPLSGRWPGVVTSIQHASSLKGRAFPPVTITETGGVLLPALDGGADQTTPVISVIQRVQKELLEKKLEVAFVAFDGVPDGDRPGSGSPVEELIASIVAVASKQTNLAVFIVATPESATYTYVLSTQDSAAYVRTILPALRAQQESSMRHETVAIEAAPGLADTGASGAFVDARGPEEAEGALPPGLIAIIDGSVDERAIPGGYFQTRPARLDASVHLFLEPSAPTSLRVWMRWSPPPRSEIATPFVTPGPAVRSTLRAAVVDTGGERSLASPEMLRASKPDLGMEGVSTWGEECEGTLPKERGGNGCGVGSWPPELRAHLVLSHDGVEVRVARGSSPRALEQWVKPLGLPPDDSKQLLVQMKEDLGRLPIVALVSSRPVLDPCLGEVEQALAKGDWQACSGLAACDGSEGVQRLARAMCRAAPRRFLPGTLEDVPKDARAGALVLLRVLARLGSQKEEQGCLLSLVRFQVRCRAERSP